MQQTKKSSSGLEGFEVTISKQQMNSLPPEVFKGEIVVIDSEDGVDSALEELRKAPLVGFDTETKPAFQKGQVNNIALLQLASADKAFLFRLCRIGMPQKIKDFLEDETVTKVGCSIKDDFHGMSRITNITPQGFIDLQDYIKQFGITDCSLTKIHSIIFGKRISKSQQLTNWEAQQLTPKQQEYASLDAVACINIYNRLKSGTFLPEESPYYKESGPCEEN